MSEHQFKGRREDVRLVTGRGRYSADYDISGQVSGHFLRADRAHAKILRINTEAARRLPGVLDIVTAADAVAAGWKGTPSTAFFKGVGGSSLRVPFRAALAHGRVRFVGEPVALIVAESDALAQDAAELVEIEYEDLPVVVEAGEAIADGAVTLHEDMPDNLAFDYEYGDWGSTEKGFADAAHVVRVELHAQRIAGNPMEPKSCVAIYDAANESYELCLPCQGAADLKSALAHITGLGPERFRIRAVDVGGGFGVRQRGLPGIPGADAGRQEDRTGGEMDRDPVRDHFRRSSRARGRSDRRAGARRATGTFLRCACDGWSISAPTAPTRGR